MTPFATPEDYAAYAEDEFDGTQEKLAKRLRAASDEVLSLTRLAAYDTVGGIPSDTAVAEAFRDAVCAIVEHWQQTDDPFDVDAAQGAVKIGSVSLGTTSSSPDNLSAREKLTRRIGNRAVTILTNAGLIGSAVAHT